MKKLLTIVLLVVASLSSCKKEEINPNTCHCGVVTRTGVYGSSTEGIDAISSLSNTQNGSVVIQNECSGKRNLFQISQNDWILVSDSTHVEGWFTSSLPDSSRISTHVCVVKYNCPFQLSKTIVSSIEVNDCFINAPEWNFH